MHIKPLLTIGMVVTVFLCAVVIIQLGASGAAVALGPGVPPPTVIPTPGGTPAPIRGGPVIERYAQGILAIQPRTTVTNPSVSAYTAEDVIQYVKTHPMRDQVSSDPTIVVDQIEFITTRVVNTRLNVSLSLPDDTLVCLVKLHGTFTHQNPLGGNPISSNNAYQVFDAHTGNLVSNIILPK